VKYLGHTDTMYTAKMCHNSVQGDRIYPLHTWVVTFAPTHNYLGTNFSPCQRRLPSNGAKNAGLYDQLDQ